MSVLLSCLRCVMRVLFGMSGVKMSEIEGVAECIFECECECVAVFTDVLTRINARELGAVPRLISNSMNCAREFLRSYTFKKY